MVHFSALALLAASAIAGPVYRRAAVPECWDWEVENMESGCGRHGCSYYFNVTVPDFDSPNGEVAGVKALCNGYEQGYDSGFTVPSTFELCKTIEGSGLQVAARFSLRPQNDTSTFPRTFQVSVLEPPSNGKLGYNYTATHKVTYNSAVAPPLNFTITPSEVSSTNDTTLVNRPPTWF
ncbi:hypothetical protein PtrSN002B_006424 [Pyrenophora tritici-repentis]|uniref:Uncharacterized protein n=2 Tax=Pyrenophora tritici-repentis TaxID=45151 RepID=A0A2W1FQ04_9PLEO|nr:uncharacterized protein PTRG_04979 [Pyrenophora tritici-repentis Pt-1C-BFP]KAA8611890.1 hypothetical protein PtrV1_13766 [Pyrenophora tritici-repentis]EDU47886.1 conserved hypothetical protein [Pyrenophora tritici-repentis Pt-1C-BFP]KAF7447210.1 hypothetical protein A1F99_086570 [Pyrenophora tritici-repentis]KAF7569558.1 hypothetical protein PtrM4_119730 [Pyrenophora tritici-repentis]KAG9382692.1 hypothetical protein A1F94_006613 [Pyrenophora tritici-repentis]